ncbi:MAG TPA: glucosidase [Anaeromyxobacter sp.]|nr:glucosidase [Anaeromyxobacter sp.]
MPIPWAGSPADAEQRRLDENERRERNWTRWGPYLAERQWGTVREDYSPDGSSWQYLPHDHARSRAYRWGEDGLLGITDRECRVCFALALWNGRDPILKERLFGLSGDEGNHGEDVKELYYYLDATPTSSYLKALYKYPQEEFPYARLLEENRRRGRNELEFELEDTGVFDARRYHDVLVEYAKASPDDILIRITSANRGGEPATLHLLPTLWLRNTWAWGREGEGYWPKGQITATAAGLLADHPSLGRQRLECQPLEGTLPRLIFTDNETNSERLFGSRNVGPYVKDAFHRLVVQGELSAVNPGRTGTKAAAWYTLSIPSGGEVSVRLRLRPETSAAEDAFGPEFDRVLSRRIEEADAYFAHRRDSPLSPEERLVVRQADAGLLWSRQYYGYVVEHWLDGDPGQPPPPRERRNGRNRGFSNLYARDVLWVPDAWEYPWFAAWDLAFQCVAAARIDPSFAKRQLVLLCREWYMHPNGQLPAYEFAFGDVNPPVHAWAAWRVYQLAQRPGEEKDRLFLESVFQKCMLNFTWWVNREDLEGNNLFAGGFLGLDNIGFFDRSRPLYGVDSMQQADATAWMAFYSSTMLAIALELAREDPAYADIASKFFEHFVGIARAMNELGGTGLWDEEDGFYYDQALFNGTVTPLRVRSMVGVIPLFAVETLEARQLSSLPLFRSRLQWFLENRPELAHNIAYMHPDARHEHRLLAVPTRERLLRVLRYVLDESEFLSPYGLRSLSRHHLEHPARLRVPHDELLVSYVPGESDSSLFGGNSNWRGPIWFPLNYLLIEGLKRFHHFYRDTLQVELPTGSGRMATLLEVAEELERRLARLFVEDATGRRPCHGDRALYTKDPHFRDLVLFHEYFHGDDGRGLGASHQTGWTALAANVLERVAAARAARGQRPGAPR